MPKKLRSAPWGSSQNFRWNSGLCGVGNTRHRSVSLRQRGFLVSSILPDIIPSFLGHAWTYPQTAQGLYSKSSTSFRIFTEYLLKSIRFTEHFFRCAFYVTVYTDASLLLCDIMLTSFSSVQISVEILILETVYSTPQRCSYNE